MSDKAAGAGALSDAVRRFDDALSDREVKQQRIALQQLLDRECELCDFGDDAWAIVDGLLELERIWRGVPAPTYTATVSLPIKTLRDALDKLVFHCSMITVPIEVRRGLDLLRVGKPLDFNQTFAAQLPNAEQRKQLLARLKHMKICGWVDTTSGYIYKLPQSSTARAFACAAPFLTALLVAAGLFGFGFLEVPDWDDALQYGGELLAAYGLVLAGAVFHLAIENVKQEQIGSAQIGAISDTIYWLNLRWPGLSLTVFWVLVVTIGLRVSGVDSNGEDIALYFFAGYSLDSVAGLVLTRFVNTSATVTKQLEEKLAPAKAGAAPA